MPAADISNVSDCYLQNYLYKINDILSKFISEHTILYLFLFLLFPLVLLLFTSQASASSLALSAPSDVDICKNYSYSLSYTCSNDVRSISASVQEPVGYSYSGNSRLIFAGKKYECEPTTNGQSLSWELTNALKSCRHIVINEWEANPTGDDYGMEWIELFNPTPRSVDIGRWKFVDSRYGRTVSIPAGTTIAAGDYYVLVWTNGSLVNSYPLKITLLDSAGLVVDSTAEKTNVASDDHCWARYPNGKDLGVDTDWQFQTSTKGLSNGGEAYDIYAGESLDLQFNLSAGCNSPEKASLSSRVATSGGSVTADSSEIIINRANLSLSIAADKYDVKKGEEIIWTVRVNNNGTGIASDVLVNANLGNGLELIEINSPNNGLQWSYASMEPGAVNEIKLRAKVVSPYEYYSCLVEAKWGCGPCQEISQSSQVSQWTSIHKSPDGQRSLAVGGVANFEISAELPGDAHDLWINDTVPKGLDYTSGSLSVQGIILQKETFTQNSDGSLQIGWFFGDVVSAESIVISYNCTISNLLENQDGIELAGTKAYMSWRSESGWKTDDDEAGAIRVVEPDLALELDASSSVVGPGDSISYTLAVYHSTLSVSSAFDVDLQDILPSGLVYSPGTAAVLNGPNADFDENNLRWHFDEISLDWKSDRKVMMRLNATSRSEPGDSIINNAFMTWTSLAGVHAQERTGSGGVNDYQRQARSDANSMGLSIRNTADPDPVKVGELLSYALVYENEGGPVANNVTITDVLDPGATFLSADPAPQNARNDTWTIGSLSPDGPHTITIQSRVSETLDDSVQLANHFTIKSDELSRRGGTIYTQVQNGTRLAVNKTALQKAVRRGEEVSYTITVCNSGGQSATNVTVRDVFDSSVEFVSAWPEMAGEGIWKFASLAPGECVQISLTVRVPRIDVKFEGHDRVKGSGFVNSYRDYSTIQASSVLTNRVYVESDQMLRSASANVKILGEDGTELLVREHGSGDYETGSDLRFLTVNKSIRQSRSMKASYRPTTFFLPRNGSQSFSSRWTEESRARNGITNTTFQESIRYSTHLNHTSLFDLDKNGSRLVIKSDFDGLAHFGTLKKPVNSTIRDSDTVAQEDYIGKFLIVEKIQDLGQSLTRDRSVSGIGYVDADIMVAGRQRSYESGTGDFRSEERIEILSNFMAKDMDATHKSLAYEISPRTSINLSQRWTEGMWSRGPFSFIGEGLSNSARLKKTATARGLGELQSDSTFSGRADLRTAYASRNGSHQVDQDDELVGDYHVARKIIISGVSKYDVPHIQLEKHGRLVKDVAVYTISLTNDGSAALGPLYLQDIFPPGARFLNSSLRPSELGPNGSKWTLLHLAIGDTVKIAIDLDVEKCDGDILNRIIAAGNCSAGQVVFMNQSIIDRAWLGGCAPAETSVQPVSISCSCLSEALSNEGVLNEELSNETMYFDPVQAPWSDEGDGGCPLNCPATEDAHASVNDLV